MTRFFEWIGKVPAAIAKLAVFVVVIASVIIIFKQLGNKAYLVEQIQVPGSLADSGYTPEVTALWVVDKMLVIQRKATTRKEDQMIIPDGQTFDMEVPGSGLTLSTIGQALRESLGIPDKTISGEIVSSATGYELRLRLSGGSGYRQATVPDRDVESLINIAAEEAVQLVAPFMFASYLHSSGRLGELPKALDYCLENQPSSEHEWAYNLRGIMLAEQKDWDAAIESYKQALESDPRFALAHYNWANALAGEQLDALQLKNDPRFALADHSWATAAPDKQLFEPALKKLAEAVAIDSDLRDPAEEAQARWKAGWRTRVGDVLRRNPARRDEAIEMYRLALELDSQQTSALLGWGLALMKNDDYATAAEKFAMIERIEGDKTLTQVYIKWGEALAKSGHSDAAIGKYEAAIATNPQGYEEILRPSINALEAD